MMIKINLWNANIPVYAVDKVAKSQVQVVRNEMWKVFNTIYLKHFNLTTELLLEEIYAGVKKSTLGSKNPAVQTYVVL